MEAYSVEELAEKVNAGLPKNLQGKYDIERMSIIIDGYMLYYENDEDVTDEEGCVVVENIDYENLLNDVMDYLEQEEKDNKDVTIEDLKEIVKVFEKI